MGDRSPTERPGVLRQSIEASPIPVARHNNSSPTAVLKRRTSFDLPPDDGGSSKTESMIRRASRSFPQLTKNGASIGGSSEAIAPDNSSGSISKPPLIGRQGSFASFISSMPLKQGPLPRSLKFYFSVFLVLFLTHEILLVALFEGSVGARVLMILLCVPVLLVVLELQSSIIDKDRLLEEAKQNYTKQKERSSALEQETISSLNKVIMSLRRALEYRYEISSNATKKFSHGMNAISALLGLLIDTRLTPEQENYIRELMQLKEQTMSIVEDAHVLFAAEMKKVTPESGPFNLETMLETMLDEVTLLPGFDEKDVDVSLAIEPDVPLQLIGDSKILQRIVKNLLSNAVKFTHKGEIIVSVSASEKTASNFKLSIAVSDTGIGIATAEMSQLFKPFPAINTAAAALKPYSGSGLGLAISDSLAKVLLGTLVARSEKNNGSVFTLCIPIAMNQNALVLEQMPISNLYEFPVLVLHPYTMTRECIARSLRQFGCKVDTACSFLDAISLLKSKPYDLALLNSTLMDTDCVELCKTIKKDPATAKVTIFVAVNSKQKRQLQAHVPHLIQAVVQKPLKKSTLFAILPQLLDIRKQISSSVNIHSGSLGIIQPASVGSSAPDMKLNVLIAEDNALSQKVLKALVERSGHSCRLAADGQQAVDEFVAHTAELDCILMDCRMPVMDGWVATKAIRAKEAESGNMRRIPIIALTADSTGKEVSIEAGMDNYLCKPVNKAELYKIFQEIIEAKKRALHRREISASSSASSTNGVGGIPGRNSGGLSESDREDSGTEQQKATILLVESNPVAANITSRVLQKNFNVEIAPHGKAALEMVKSREAYDLILMDVELPVMDGLTCARLIRDYEAEQARLPISIIALARDGSTSSGRLGDSVRKLSRESGSRMNSSALDAQYLEAGFNDIIKKPLDYPELLKKIRTLLGP